MNLNPAAPASAAPEYGKPEAFRWRPVRALAPRHRPRILAHLLALENSDRYLRFGHAASDSQIARYVDQLDFDRDEVFGVFNRRLELIAMTHLAYLHRDPLHTAQAEFGVSVLPRARGRGLGGRLFDLAVLHARNRGVDTLVIHALSENTAMLHIVRQAGATLERSGSESTALLKLAPEDFSSRLEEQAETHAAEIDYCIKQQAHRLGRLARTLREQVPDDLPMPGP